VTGAETYRFLTGDLGMTIPVAEDLFGEAEELGWSQFAPCGSRQACIAKLPNTSGERSSRFQVTVK
jgi:hypothetical protein